jgi:hypothetical protein
VTAKLSKKKRRRRQDGRSMDSLSGVLPKTTGLSAVNRAFSSSKVLTTGHDNVPTSTSRLPKWVCGFDHLQLPFY